MIFFILFFECSNQGLAALDAQYKNKATEAQPRICQSLYDVKQKAQSERLLRLTAQLAIISLIASYCTRRHSNFKGLSQDGGRTDFYKTLRTFLFN
jgi:hypothetical protein